MTTTPTPQTPELTVDEFSLSTAGSHGRPLHFSTDDEDVYPERRHLERAGTIVVYVGVDGEHDMVAMDENRSSQLALLDAAIRDLQQVRDTLATLTPSAAEGRCMNSADWGRCKHRESHEGPCEGPTEAQWQAAQDALAPVRARRSA